MAATIAAMVLALAFACAEGAPVPAWEADVTASSIPAAAANGMVHGVAFKIDDASISHGILHLKQGTDFFADQEFAVFTFVMRGPLDGKKFVVKPAGGVGQPHVHLKYKVAGKHTPEIEIFTKGYTMQLEFGTASGKKLPGKIYLCLPDTAKSFVVGTFEADTQ